MTDVQLVEEFQDVCRGLGRSINAVAILIATRPQPAYVLSSSTTNFYGTIHASASVYSMPSATGRAWYGSATGTISGTATTQYHYADKNATARTVNEISTAIHAKRISRYKARGTEVLAEVQRRIDERRLAVEADIKRFFTAHPDLEARRPLFAAVVPWIVPASNDQGGPSILEAARARIESMTRGEGMSGQWYGLFSQETRLSNGETVAFNSFVRLDLVQSGDSVRGKGELGSGEVIDFQATLLQGELKGVVANTTSAINSKVAGIVAENQVTASFTGVGVGQELKGTAILLR
jgi:hypothetical protein